MGRRCKEKNIFWNHLYSTMKEDSKEKYFKEKILLKKYRKWEFLILQAHFCFFSDNVIACKDVTYRDREGRYNKREKEGERVRYR